MWTGLLLEIEARIIAVQAYLSAVIGPRGSPPAIPTPQPELTARGLMFVQLYAVYEYAVNEMVREAIVQIKAHGLHPRQSRFELLALLLDAELQAAIDAGATTRWGSRISLMRGIDSSAPCATRDSVFPNDGTHYRVGQLYTIWEVFGITSAVVHTGRAIGLISELVENRNAIAHGRRTAEDVGRSVSPADCYSKVAMTKELCDYLVTTMRAHCSHAPNLTR